MNWIKGHKKLCVSLAVVLCLVTVIGVVNIRMGSKRRQMMAAGFTQETATVERRSLVESISATGTVISAKSRTVEAAVSGVEVTEVFVEVGDTVQMGDAICQMDTSKLETNLQNTRNSLNVSQQKNNIDISAAERNLSDAQTQRDVELQRADEKVAEAWTEYAAALDDMEDAEDDYDKAASKTSKANKAYKTAKKLSDAAAEQLASMDPSDESYAELQTEYESLLAETEKLLSDYNTLKETSDELKKVYEKAEDEAEAKKETYDQLVENRSDSARNLDSTVNSRSDSLTTSRLNASVSGTNDQNQIEEYQKQIDACNVTAPIAGVVTAVNVEAGDNYNGSGIVIIEDTSSYEVTTEIDEYDIGKIEKGQRVVIKTNGTGDLQLEGTVRQIAPRASSSASSVTYTVTVSIDTPCDELRLDMTAKLSIIIESRDDVLTVPYDAVQEAEDGSFYVEVVGATSAQKSDRNSAEKKNVGNFDSRNRVDGQGNRDVRLGGAGQTGASTGGSNRVTVVKGIESDYYVEISGEQVVEGMQVLVPNSDSGSMNIQNMMRQRGPMGGF